MGEKYFQDFGPAQTLASNISEFWTCPNPCVKDFRMLDFWISRFPYISNLARPRPDLRYLGTWKSRSLESHGTLATKISEFWTYWNPCVKDFRILDLLEPLRQRFPDFQITPEILAIYGVSSSRVSSHGK